MPGRYPSLTPMLCIYTPQRQVPTHLQHPHYVMYTPKPGQYPSPVYLYQTQSDLRLFWQYLVISTAFHILWYPKSKVSSRSDVPGNRAPLVKNHQMNSEKNISFKKIHKISRTLVHFLSNKHPYSSPPINVPMLLWVQRPTATMKTTMTLFTCNANFSHVTLSLQMIYLTYTVQSHTQFVPYTSCTAAVISLHLMFIHEK
jgi:hypothetical protein